MRLVFARHFRAPSRKMQANRSNLDGTPAAPMKPQTPEEAARAAEAAAGAPLEQHNLAYRDQTFLDTPDARPLRIMSEYFEPLRRLRRENVHDTIVFFGSARIPGPEAMTAAQAKTGSEATGAGRAGELARYYEEARDLAHRLTEWSRGLHHPRRRFVIASGGGPGIMEAANRGAAEAGGATIGFNIQLPFEQNPNRWITPSLNFQFHYFFMRKFWFAYLAKALVAFPGGFGTLDEVSEILTLAQTQKLAKKIVVALYGEAYWREVLNFDAFVRWGTIGPGDTGLFHFVNTPQEAYDYLTGALTEIYLQPPPEEEGPPGIAKTR